MQGMLGEKWGLADLQFSWAATPSQIKQYGYPIDEPDAWDEKNRVQCRASKRLTMQHGDRA